MAITPSPLPFASYTATALVANPAVLGTTGLPGTFAPFSNTKDIVFLNRDAANDLFIKVVDFSLGLPAAITAADSLVVPAGAAITLNIGVAGERGNLGDTGVDTPLVIIVQASVANVIFNCTYVQASGLP